MNENIEKVPSLPDASWPATCSPGEPGWHYIVQLVKAIPTVTLAEARRLLSTRDDRLKSIGADDTPEDYDRLLRDEPDDVRLYDAIQRRAAAGDAQAEEIMEQFRSDPDCFPGSILVRAAADKHPGWERTYRHRVHDDDRGWSKALCRKLGEGPEDEAELLAWFREAHPEEAAGVEARAVDLLLDRWAVEACAEARAEHNRQVEAERLKKDVEAGRPRDIMAMAEEFADSAPIVGPEGALVAALRWQAYATIAEVKRALDRVIEWGADHIKLSWEVADNVIPNLPPCAAAAKGVRMWIESALGKEPRETAFREATMRLARAGDPAALRIRTFYGWTAPENAKRRESVSEGVHDIYTAFGGTASYGGPETGLDFVMRQVSQASIGEVETALRKAASERPSSKHDAVPNAAAGALMWFESVLGSEPADCRFTEAVSRLAQAGDAPARRIYEVPGQIEAARQRRRGVRV